MTILILSHLKGFIFRTCDLSHLYRRIFNLFILRPKLIPFLNRKFKVEKQNTIQFEIHDAVHNAAWIESNFLSFTGTPYPIIRIGLGRILSEFKVATFGQ